MGSNHDPARADICPADVLHPGEEWGRENASLTRRSQQIITDISTYLGR